MTHFKKWANVPELAQKPITSGANKGLTSICPMWRIEQLTDVFGDCGVGWWIEIDRAWSESGFVFCQIKLFYKKGDEISMSIPGVGSSELTDGNAIKKAQTAAIGNACKLLGMGAEIYKKRHLEEESPIKSRERVQVKKTIKRKPALP